MKTPSISSLLLCAALSLSACGHAPTHPAQPQTSTRSQSAEQAAVWIDVRTASEFANGHLPGAVNIPYERIAEHITTVAADKTTPINVYCRSGRRSEIARKALIKMGYTDVVNKGAYRDLR